MAQAGRKLEPPRPLKSTIKQSQSIQQSVPAQQMVYYTPTFEVQTIDDLISLTETVASALQTGNVTAELINKLSANLCIHGPQLELISKDTLDRAFIIFRNASQDDRLKITVRLTLLQLIELRANSWQISDGLNTYYKHKATNVEPENDLNVLSTSPSSGQILAPGELVKNSGKFSKPTKIPGKNYSKDEIVIRNADSGKVNAGAKERLVQITGPNEEKINYAKQLIEETIRRNASPVRLENSQDGSCSSLASSVSDEQVPRTTTNRNSIGASIGGNAIPQQVGTTTQQTSQNMPYVQQQMANHKLSRSSSTHHSGMAGMGPVVGSAGGNMLIHSLSTSDASLGEYKYTVSVGPYSVKITGDCFDLVRAAKLVLDDYFSSKEFLESTDAAPLIDQSMGHPLMHQVSGMIPPAHQLASQSPFVDSGVSLDMLANHSSGFLSGNAEIDDDVFLGPGLQQQHPHQISQPPQQTSSKASSEEKQMITSISSTSTDSTSSSNTITATGNKTPNGLNRSKRTNFPKKEISPESVLKILDDDEPRIVYDEKNLVHLSKTPLSRALPPNWSYICEKMPSIIKQETSSEADTKLFFDGDKFLEMKDNLKDLIDDDVEIIEDLTEDE